MRKSISCALALAVGQLGASDQVTVFNSHALMKFEKTSLQVRRFDFPSLEKLDDERTLRICEALDNSRFVYFGSKFDIEHRIALYRALFESEAVRRSLSDFLVRGGLVFFSPLNWTQLESWPREMVQFFAARGVAVPTGKNCVNTSDEPKREYQVVGKIAPAFRGTLFSGPRKCEPIRAIRHFGELPGDCWKPVYVSEKEGWPIVIAADCSGGGRVVFSHVFSVDRMAASPFYLNILEGMYGPGAVRLRSSRAAYLEDAKKRGLEGLHIREVPPFTRMFSDSKLAEEGADLKEITFTLARNDRELAQIALYNCTDENFMFRLEPSAKDAKKDMFRFYDVLPWMATNEQVYDEIVAEPNGADVISVPSGETKTILLAAKTDRAPGTYDWGFSFVPVNLGEMKRRGIKVRAEVLDLRLEEKDMPDCYTFGPYDPSFSECPIWACRDYMAENHVNIMIFDGGGPRMAISKGADGKAVLSDRAEDYLSDEKLMQQKDLRWVYGYRIVWSFLNRLKNLGIEAKWEDESTKALFREWARRWSAALKEAGIDPNRHWVPLEDEPRTPQIPQLVEAAKILRSVGFRTCVTIASWGVREDLESFKGVIDLWIPWESRLCNRPDTAASELAFYKSTGKPFLPYLCSISSTIAPYQNYFRFRGIRSFLLGADGIALWAANSWRGNDYYAPDDARRDTAFLFHHGSPRPVGTMRFEAFREGIEDLYWLRRAAASGKPGAVKFTEREGLEKLMAADDPALVRQWRDRLLRELSR